MIATSYFHFYVKNAEYKRSALTELFQIDLLRGSE